MTKRFIGQLTILAMLLSSAASVIAQDEGSSDDDRRKYRGHRMHRDDMGRGMGDPARMLEMMTNRLDLDETQSQQLSNIMTAAQPEIQELRDGRRENRDAMRSLDTNDPDYSAKLQNLSAANANLAARMTLLRGRLRADVHALLTPEQLQTIEERGERFRGHGRHRDGEESIR